MTLKINTGSRIWLLLAVLTLCFFITALLIRFSFDPKQILLHDTQQLERNIHKKEQLVFDFLEREAWVEEIKSLEGGDLAPLEERILKFTEENNIFTYAYANNTLVWWSTNTFVPKTDAGISDGSNLLNGGNGWYYSIKKTEGSFSMLFLIPIKWEYHKNNSYFSNHFSNDLIQSRNLEITLYSDPDTYNIRSSSGQYLFSVKLAEVNYDYFLLDWELLMWMLGFVFTLINLNIFCSTQVRKGRFAFGVILFGFVLFGLRLLDLQYEILSSHFFNSLLDSRLFAASFWFPNLGGLILNVLTMTWFLGFLYVHRKYMPASIPFFSSQLGLFVFASISFTVFYGGSLLTSDIYFSLINHSNINLDVSDMLNLDTFGWISILTLGGSVIAFLFLIGVFVHVAKRIIPNRNLLLRYEIIILTTIAILLILLRVFDVSYLLISSVIVLATWYGFTKEKYDLAVLISTLLLLATVSALKHGEFHKFRRQEAQKMALIRLEDIDDVNALALFYDLEKEIVEDPVIKQYFIDSIYISQETFSEHLKTVYFSGYLSKYDYTINQFDEHFNPIGGSSSTIFNDFRDKVISGSIKVTQNFYRGEAGFGKFEYFAQFPIYEKEELLGILLIDLRNNSFNQFSNYPVILSDSRIDQRQNELLAEYSYAFYRDGKIVSQNGKYVYPITDERYRPIGIRDFKRLKSDSNYSHIAYRSNDRNLLVLSKPEQSGWLQFASISFFFLVYLMLFFVLYVIQWTYTTLNSHDFSLRNLRWSVLLVSNRILFSTRVQMLIVVAVVFTLLTAGIITFYSISRQFLRQQENQILSFAWDLAHGLESKIHRSGDALRPEMYKEFDDLSETVAMDLNLYNASGELIYSTQPRIYDLRLISRYIDPEALLQLKHYERFQFIKNDQIGTLPYITAYASIRNDQMEPIAYVSMPSYSSQTEFDNNIGNLLNVLINIYALVILVLGLFAVFAANRMTEPLLLVQRSLARTKIGEQNEPIFWKRNDEIGSLIREYNLMIAELEESAKMIVKSERESAWREMAKQVAHEIKNPLTPLKLGMQQLERSWLDGDPGFEARFKRFSTSFIEQIDSLTHIASEFSDFAKMPATKLEDVDLYDLLEKSISVYSSTSNLKIEVFNNLEMTSPLVKGDKDQVLRMFNNLIKNAIEASINRRKMRVNIVISQSKDLKWVLIEVQDFGEGIPRDIQNKLFQPNFTTKSSGTGLGLAFVKRVVDGMQGEITYTTEIGHGTTFKIQIPVQPKPHMVI